MFGFVRIHLLGNPTGLSLGRLPTRVDRLGKHHSLAFGECTLAAQMVMYNSNATNQGQRENAQKLEVYCGCQREHIMSRTLENISMVREAHGWSGMTIVSGPVGASMALMPTCYPLVQTNYTGWYSDKSDNQSAAAEPWDGWKAVVYWETATFCQSLFLD